MTEKFSNLLIGKSQIYGRNRNQTVMKSEIIELDGYVSSVNGEYIDPEEFLDKFIEFIESNGWSFFGSSGEYKEEHEET